jgi:hypothetical protein
LIYLETRVPVLHLGVQAGRITDSVPVLIRQNLLGGGLEIQKEGRGEQTI